MTGLGHMRSLMTMQGHYQEQVKFIQALLASRVEAENKGQGLRKCSRECTIMETFHSGADQLPDLFQTITNNHKSLR